MTNELNKKKKSLEIALRRLVSTSKETPVLKYTGCQSPSEFLERIQAKFIEGMTPSNYIEVWTLDHIVPQFFFDLSQDNDIMLCYNHNNLLPMLKSDNHLKEHCPLASYDLLSHMKESPYKTLLIEKIQPFIHTFDKYKCIL